MRDALATRGVNVRPRKPQLGSRAPRGISVGAHYAHWQQPAGGAHGREMRRLRGLAEVSSAARRLDRVRAEMYAAQDLVRELRAAGQDYEQAARRARSARAEWLKINGQDPSGTVEVSQGASSGKVKPLD